MLEALSEKYSYSEKVQFFKVNAETVQLDQRGQDIFAELMELEDINKFPTIHVYLYGKRILARYGAGMHIIADIEIAIKENI
jgi:hypothetical protein